MTEQSASGAGLGGITEQSCAQFEWGTCSCPRECPDPAPDDTADLRTEPVNRVADAVLATPAEGVERAIRDIGKARCLPARDNLRALLGGKP